jgi:hypothetical protein
VSDPVTLRLAAWTWLTGRTDAHAFFPARVQGLRLAADALEPRMRARGAPRATREDIEFVLGAAVALAWGYSLARPAITASHRAPRGRQGRCVPRARGGDADRVPREPVRGGVMTPA